MAGLRGFLEVLDREGELHRVGREVSRDLEIATVAHLMARRPAPVASRAAAAFDPARAGLGGRAVLFESVAGSDFPVAINVFGSYRRMELAFGRDFESIAARIAGLVKPEPPRSFGEALAAARRYAPLLRIGPKLVRRGPCREVVRRTDRGEVDLHRLPLLKCWPLDGDPAAVGCRLTPEQAGTAAGGGRYVTFAGMHTIHADDVDVAKPASHNVGMYRAQLVDATRLAMHWHVHHDGAAHWRSWKRRGEPMPIAICLGGEPVLPFAATAPLPPGISELLMAGFLNGRGIPLVRAETVPLRVPANAEIVIEGFVHTDAGGIGWDPDGAEPLGPGAVFEGPFGDHTGFYSLPDRYPIVEVTAITHRRDAIFPATVVGAPPQEDYYLGKATERLFLPLLRTIVPDVLDYHLPMFGCFHNCAFLRIDKHYPLQARRVMHAIWGAGQMAWTKMIVVVDEDVPVHDEAAVWRAVFERCRFDRDLEIVHGPLDILDHAAPELGAGGKIGIDATRRWPGEAAEGVAHDAGFARPGAGDLAPRLARVVGQAGIRAVAAPEVGAGRLATAAIDKASPGDGGRALAALRAAGGPDLHAAIVVASEHDPADLDAVLFALAAHFDPTRDLHRDGAFAGFDGTPKQPGDERRGVAVRRWPPAIAPDPSLVASIMDRAPEYGLDPSPRAGGR